MLSKFRWKRTVAAPEIYLVQQKAGTQTSGIFRLPLELFLEIFSYLTDHRCFIRENYYGRDTRVNVRRGVAARSITIRRLTMTCWPLRNLLLPLLWVDVEGFIAHFYYDPDTRQGGEGSHLYAQCVYLRLNPEIATYVRAISVNLHISESPPDLMIEFAECLAQLPNLKTLEILSVDSQTRPISKAFRHKRVTLPSIRELRIVPACHDFIENCPNLEELIFTRPTDTEALSATLSRGEGLKRIAGMSLYHGHEVNAIILACPNLREIGLVGDIRESHRKQLQVLRQLNHLTVIDINIERGSGPSCLYWEIQTAWKRDLANLLMDNPSTDRKFVRWKVVVRRRNYFDIGWDCDVVETEELEVSPKTSP